MRYLLLLVLLSSQLLARTKPDEELLRITVKGKIGFINLNGKVVIEPQFKAVGHFVDGLAPARKGGTYGYIDKTGKFVIPDIYDYAEDFRNGYGIVYLEGKPQYINRLGKMPFHINFSTANPFFRGRAIVSIGENGTKYGVIDERGKLVLKTVYGYISDEGEGVFLTSRFSDHLEMGYGNILVDSNGKELLQTKDTGFFCKGFNNGVGSWFNNLGDNTFTVMNLKGEALFKGSADWISTPSQANCVVTQLPILAEKTSQKLYSLKKLSSPDLGKDTFLRVVGFSEHRAFAMRQDSTLCLLNDDAVVIHTFPKAATDHFYDFIRNTDEKEFIFKNGTAIVKTSGGYGVVDSMGRIVIPFNYLKLFRTPNPTAFVYRCDTCQSSIFGIFNFETGKVTTPFFYYSEETELSTDKALFCRLNQRPTYLTYQGEVLWQGSYSFDTVVTNRDVDCIDRNHFRPIHWKPVSCDSLHSKPWFAGTNRRDDNANSIYIHVDPSDTISYQEQTYESGYNDRTAVGFKIYLVNNSNGDCYFSTIGPWCMQAKDKHGKWVTIDYQDFGCVLPGINNKYSTHTYTIFSSLPYTGTLKTKLRIKAYMGFTAKSLFDGIPIYSNEFDGNINPGQLWRQTGFVRNEE